MRRAHARTRRRFALSSRIAPFGLIAVTGQGRGAVADDGSAAASLSRSVAPADVTLVVSNGQARIGARVYALDALRPAAVRLRESGVGSILLMSARSARTADVARALDALRQAGLPDVRLIAPPAGASGTGDGEARP